MRRVFVGRGCLSCIRVFFSPPNTENGILAGADRGATGGAAPLFATPRFSPSSGKTPGVAGAVGAPSRSSAMDSESDERPRGAASHERARQGRPRRPNGARPRRRGSTRARRPRSARRPRRRRERSQRRERAVLALESSGIGPSRASRRASPRAPPRRPPRRRRAGPRPRRGARARTRRGASPDQSRSDRRFRRRARAPPAARALAPVARAASKLTRSERDARDEPRPRRGRRCSLC